MSRANIKQVKKDEDNEELKYCVRSILENIPWIRKIFILMPNDKVKYFKPIEEIKEKIVYVKDKDFLGFDSSNSNTFQYNLYNITKFGISDNFILMDDDYFIGKPINKTKFFYYDEEQKKVLPSIVSDDFSELNKEDTISKLNKINRKRNINLHSFYGWKLSQLNAFLFLLEQFGSPLINAGFTHNAIPININDMKELFDLMKNNYTDANEILYAKERTIHDLQFQSLYMTYSLNVKKRKVNSIPWIYIDLGEANLKSLNIELFVINTSGDRIYKKEEYQTAKDILEIKFNKPTKYEIVLFDKTENISHNTNKSIDNNQFKNIEIQKQINDSSQILNKDQKNESKSNDKTNEEKQNNNYNQHQKYPNYTNPQQQQNSSSKSQNIYKINELQKNENNNNNYNNNSKTQTQNQNSIITQEKITAINFLNTCQDLHNKALEKYNSNIIPDAIEFLQKELKYLIEFREVILTKKTFLSEHLKSINSRITEDNNLILQYNENKYKLLNKIYSFRPLLQNETIEKYISSKIILKAPINFSDIYDFTLKRNLSSEIKQKWNKCVTINYRLFLLYGPKGCGKTLISQALSLDNKFKFYMLDSMEPINNINNYMLNLSKILNYNHPVCLFIKNIEALLPKLTQINYLIDKILEYEDNVVIVSSNVDPNRLPNDFMNRHKIYFFVGAVKPQDKINYIKFISQKLNIKLDIDNSALFDFCVSNLINYNNEDIKNLLVLAKEVKSTKATESINGNSVDMDDLIDAKNKVAGNLTLNVIQEFYQTKNNPDNYI